jgi:RimJ/RimL family protein N-acetyltransferase
VTDCRSYRVPLIGHIVDLIPLAPAHDEAIVALRNSPHARLFFDSTELDTVASHRQFYTDYLAKTDDVYWVVARKNGTIVGANALYNITAQGGEKGRQIVDETAARTAPIALEAELLLLDHAFHALKLPYVTALVRPDNLTVHSFNLRLGFQPLGNETLRGRDYTRYILSAADYNPTPHRPLIAYWAGR